MSNQDVTDLQWYGLHTNLAGLDGPKRVRPLHSVRTRSNFNRAVFPRNPHQAKTDNDRIYGERKIWSLRKERTLIVRMHALILRSAQRHIAAPLAGNDTVVHEAAHDTEHVRIEEELR